MDPALLPRLYLGHEKTSRLADFKETYRSRFLRQKNAKIVEILLQFYVQRVKMLLNSI